MSALAAQRPQRMQLSLFLSSFPCLCPCLWAWIDHRKIRRDQVETPPQTRNPKACPTTAVVIRSSLSPTGNMPSRAICVAIASSKPVDEEYLIGPIDQHGLMCSSNKALDDANYVLQAGVATEAELIVATGKLVGSDPQIELLPVLIARFQLLLFHKLVEPTARRTSDSQHEDPSSTAKSCCHQICKQDGHQNGTRMNCRPPAP